jgi:SAM-dependent methyltransferase
VSVTTRKGSDVRPPDRIRAHYEIERELADRLRHASAVERLGLYGSLYDTLFASVPDHPLLTDAPDEARRRAEVEAQLRFLTRFIVPDSVFLEVGAGDCALAREVARTARVVYAVDVSESITSDGRDSGEIEVILSDGVSIDVPQGAVDLVYSNQLMEHLHPDDALAHLGNIRRALAPGGRYVCVTPNRLNGPHDVSKYFDAVATGFHLKEYTVTELAKVMRQAGFSHVSTYAHVRGMTMRLPLALVVAVEEALERVPTRARTKLAAGRPCRWMLGIRMVGEAR